MSTRVSDQTAMEEAVRHLASTYSPKGNYIGWLMLASIFVEAWDFYSIAFVLIFVREAFNPPPLMLGVTAAAIQAGVVVGSLLGGWLTDKLGRRLMFLTSIFLFMVLALAQGFVTGMVQLLAIRFILGIPLGSDITTGYTYMMEYMPTRRREIVASRWQVMFSAGQGGCAVVVALLLVCGMGHDLIWRSVLAFGAVPALIILLLRKDLPETAIWLIRQGRFREGKATALRMYNDALDMLPDRDIVIEKPHVTEFITDLRRDPIKWRATVYSWIALFCCAGEFSTFGFYVPVIFMLVGVSSLIGTSLMSGAIWIVAGISGWVGPALVPKFGHRAIGISGFATAVVGLAMAAAALYTNHPYVLPLAAAIMMWGHVFAISNTMTIATVVARARYRGMAGGFAYIFNKAPLFMGIFLFPSLFAAIGQANATLFIMMFPIVGVLSAIFIFKEVYGYQTD